MLKTEIRWPRKAAKLLSTRKVFYAPIKLQPDGANMKQVAKILIDSEDGFLQGKRYLISLGLIPRRLRRIRNGFCSDTPSACGGVVHSVIVIPCIEPMDSMGY